MSKDRLTAALMEMDRVTAPLKRMMERVNRANAPMERVMERIRTHARQVLDRVCLAHAQHGDTPEAARYLIGRMADHLETGEPMNDELNRWCIDALRSISNDGVDANRALGLKPTKGKRARGINGENTRIRDRLLAMEVQQLVNEGIQPTRNPLTTKRESACSIVAERNGFEESYVSKVYYRERPFEW